MTRALAVLATLFALPAFADELNGKVAVLVNTTAGGPALADVAKKVYGDVAVVDAEAVRGSMSKDGEAILTEARAKGIRAAQAADRLLVIELHTTAAGVTLLQVRAFDATGASHRRNVEVTDATIGSRLQRVLEELPQALPRKKTFAQKAHFATTSDEIFFDVNVFGGRKTLDEGEWDGLAEQSAVGLFGTFGPTTWPVHVALEGYGARSHDGNLTATITEFGAGLRRVFAFGPVRPYIGAGVEMARADFDVEVAEGEFETDTGRATGAWAGAGAAFRLKKYGNVGLQVRWSTAEVELGSRSVDAGGLFVGLTVGMGSAVPGVKP